MKIYLASSWKNSNEVNDIASFLRDDGFEVDAFCDESSGRFVFHYSELGPVAGLNAVSFLEFEKSKKAFNEDKKWLDWCDVCIMVLPCGNSSHLEGGYAKGCGKKLIIYSNYFKSGEFDVMYGFADLITDNYAELTKYLGGENIQSYRH